jgi:hypothetical protein
MSSPNQIKKKYLAPEVISYFDDQIDAAELLISGLESNKADKSYVDSQDDAKLLEAKSYADGKSSDALTSAQGYTDQKISDLVAGAPEALDTLKELADMLNDQEDAVSSLVGQISSVANDVSDLDAYAQDIRGDLDQEILDRGAAVSAEASAREAADNALDARIDALETAPPAMVAHKMSPITVSASELSYIDCEHQAKPMSLHVFVGRLAVHEGVDYTLSTVSGKTRITWAGSLVNPSGVESIELGDRVYISYMR